MTIKRRRPRPPFGCPTCGSGYLYKRRRKGGRLRITGRKDDRPWTSYRYGRPEVRSTLRVYWAEGRCPDPYHERMRLWPKLDPKPAETEPSWKPAPSKQAAKKARHHDRQSKARR